MFHALCVYAVIFAACCARQKRARRADFIEGRVVSGTTTPEAGVWVIAETADLCRRRIARSSSTDDAGRFVLPGLPPADYQVWVRGYGLVGFGEDACDARVSR